ncbi:MAG: hypothetical protein AAGE52_15990, partial [Myxococcota bacterium]
PTVHERPRVLGKLSELGHHTTRVRKRVFLCDLAPPDAQVASVRISGFVRANLDAAVAEVATELGVPPGRVEHTLFLPVRELDPLRRIARLHDCVLIAGPAETKLRATGIKASKTQLNLSQLRDAKKLLADAGLDLVNEAAEGYVLGDRAIDLATGLRELGVHVELSYG